MADWAAIYERAEDRTLEMLRKRAERRKAQQIIKDSLQGTTTMLRDEKYDTRCDDGSAELNTGIPSQKQHNGQSKDLVERILPY